MDATEGSHPQSTAFQALQWGPLVLARDENLDPEFNKPVRIITDDNGSVPVQKVRPTFSGTNLEFMIPTTDGDIHMSDYASVNGWNGAHVCTWLPQK